MRTDELLGWAHRPGSEGWFIGDFGEFKTWVRINAHGLRDREIAPGKPAGTLRILALGDSITAAFQVPLEATFEKVLEADLNGRAGSRRAEVLNGGVNGYGTDQELLFYRHRGAEYRPDVVLVMFYLGNDVQDNDPDMRAPFSHYEKPHFVLARGGLELVDYPYRLSGPGRARAAVQESLAHLMIYRLAYVSAARLGLSPHHWARGDVAIARTSGSATAWAKAWRLTQALLLEFRRQVEADGATLVVAVVPPPEDVDPDYWERVRGRIVMPADLEVRIQEPAVTAFLERERFHVVRLGETLRDVFRRTGRPLYFDFDRHFNPEGHRVVAGSIARTLATAGLVPDATRPR